MNIKAIFFLISLLMLLILFNLFVFYPPMHLSSSSNLSLIEENTKVITEGSVASYEYYYGKKMCILDNKIKFKCKNSSLLVGKSVEVIGFLEYKENPYIYPISIIIK